MFQIERLSQLMQTHIDIALDCMLMTLMELHYRNANDAHKYNEIKTKEQSEIEGYI